MLNLLVSVHVRAEKRATFLAAIARNAHASVSKESGCLQFDVFEDESEVNHFFYYERYTDRAAFDAHKASDHFAAWRAVADLVIVAGSQENTFGSSVTTVIDAAST